MYEDTVRVLRLAEPRSTHPEIFLRGDFRQGRNGVYLEYNDTIYSPDEMGRRFAVNLINQLLADRQKFTDFNLFIEASTVKFDDIDERSSGGSIVRHLRLIDIYERLLVRALKCVRGSPTKVMLSKAFSVGTWLMNSFGLFYIPQHSRRPLWMCRQSCVLWVCIGQSTYLGGSSIHRVRSICSRSGTVILSRIWSG